jgi:hypothetical protein
VIGPLACLAVLALVIAWHVDIAEDGGFDIPVPRVEAASKFRILSSGLRVSGEPAG